MGPRGECRRLRSWLGVSCIVQAAGHRPMVSGVSCGQRFGSARDPLEVPDLEEYWGAHRIVTCDAPVFWVNFSVAGSVRRYLDISAGSLHPASSFRSDRLWDVRVDALVLAPGLPLLDTSEADLAALEIPEGSHGMVLRSPDDVSSCAHAETELNVKVRQGLCGYFDNFGAWGVWSSVLLDRHVEVSAGGLVAFWLRGLRTGKLWVMLGAAGPETEDLIGTRLIPKASCDCGPVDPERPYDAFSGQADFWELWSEGLPLVTECAGEPPRDAYCTFRSSTSSVSEPSGPSTSGTAMGTSSETATSDTWSTSRAPTSATSVSATSAMTLPSTSSSSSSSASSSASWTSTSPSPPTSTTQATTLGSLMGLGCGRDCGFREAQQAVVWRMQRHMAIRFSCDVALDFVRAMIFHHEGAVEMCEALDSAQSWAQVGLVHFCSHVALEQMWEVRGMRRWLEDRGLSASEACSDDDCNVTCQSARAFHAANRKMHEAMSINYTCSIEEDFVQAMLPHHQGAVDMCAVLLTSSTDVYLLDLCANITRMQAAEMAWMQEWLQFQGKAVGASCHDVQPQSYCADVMPITDVCHDLGGDRVCNCSGLIDSCSTTATAGGRRFAVSMVCRKSCGLCEEKAATDILMDLLQLTPITQEATSTTMLTSTVTEGTTTRPRAMASAAMLPMLPMLPAVTAVTAAIWWL